MDRIKFKTNNWLPLVGAAASSLLLVLLTSCRSDPAAADLRALGETLCLELEFDKAIPVLKAHLLENPNDAGSHFYLGRAYLNASKQWLMVAQGEIETALGLFRRQGKKSSISRFSDTYFEQICYLESAKVHLQQILLLQRLGAPPQEIEPYLDKVAELNGQARAVDATSDDVTLLEKHVSAIRSWIENQKQAGTQTPPGEIPKKRLPVPKPSEDQEGRRFMVRG